MEDFRNKGYARKLLEHCINDLKSEGFHNIRLTVYKGNKAIKIYEELGFEEFRVVVNKRI